MMKVTARSGSRRDRFIEEIGETGVLVNLTESAREGKANVELIKRMARVLSVSSADVVIVSGHRTREKTVLVRGKSKAYVRDCLLKT